MSLKVLLTGPAWFGDLLPFCEHALESLGAEVRSVAVNRAPWLPAAERRRAAMERVGWIGPKVGFRMQRRERRRLAEHVNRQVAAALEEWRPDLLLALLSWGDPLLAETMARRRDLVRVGWIMDDPFLDDVLAARIEGYDHLYVIDDSWAAPIRLLTGRPTSTLACGADPASFYRLPDGAVPAELRSRAVFVGSSYRGVPAGVVRRRLLSAVADLGLAIYGDPGWAAGGPPLAACFRGRGLDTAGSNAAYNGADIAINIHHPQFRAGTSLRTFAICAAGAFQIVDWRPGLEAYFVPEEEIVAYRTPEELRELARRYLADEPARRRIARAGMARAQRDHTYAARLTRILTDVGLLGRLARA